MIGAASYRAARKGVYHFRCSLSVIDRQWFKYLPPSSRKSSTSKQNNDTIDKEQQMFGSGLSRILTDEQRSLFRQINQLSSLSRSLARKVGGVPVKEDSLLADVARSQKQRRQQQSPTTQHQDDDKSTPPSLFTVVFAGEFNSGKSTLINALLGKELLDAGVLPTTDAITIIMANEEDCDNDAGTSSVVESSSIGLDSGISAQTQLHLLPTKSYPILSDLCLIDTPGTNAILSLQHTSSTLRILHDADLIVFVTSADR